MHPICEWLCDRLVAHMSRHAAPIVRVNQGIPAGRATFLVQTVIANRRSQPTLNAWFGVELPLVDSPLLGPTITALADLIPRLGLGNLANDGADLDPGPAAAPARPRGRGRPRPHEPPPRGPPRRPPVQDPARDPAPPHLGRGSPRPSSTPPSPRSPAPRTAPASRWSPAISRPSATSAPPGTATPSPPTRPPTSASPRSSCPPLTPSPNPPPRPGPARMASKLDTAHVRNVGEFYSQHYLDAVLAEDLDKVLEERWTTRESDGGAEDPLQAPRRPRRALLQSPRRCPPSTTACAA